MFDAEQLVRQFVPSIPLFLAYVGGIIACIACWGRSPRAAAFALIGLVVMLLEHALGQLATIWLIHRANELGNPGDIGAMLSSLSIVRAFGHAVGIGFLIGAVFIDRAQHSSDRSGEV